MIANAGFGKLREQAIALRPGRQVTTGDQGAACDRQQCDAQRGAQGRAAAAVLSKREILIAGAIAYWCEGSKNKPHRRWDRVAFINSDPALISFFLRFLDAAGIERDRLIFRIYIHQSADVEAAQTFWLEAVQAAASQFRKTTLKKHNAATIRRNTGEGFYGCLRIDVRRSADLYGKIEGWAAAAMASSA
jgi:hypothetical protein